MSVILNPVTPAQRPIALELDDYPTRSGGLGGWEGLARPRHTAAAGWVGLSDLTWSLPLIIDGMEAGGIGIDRDIQPDVDAILAMGLPTPQTDEPPILQIIGLRFISTASRWVLQEVDLGASVSANGVLVQQELTVTVQQYVAAQIVNGPAAKARSRNKQKTAAKNAAAGVKKAAKAAKGK